MSSAKVRHKVIKKEKYSVSTEDIVEDTIRMNINIAKSFHKQIKQKALDEETTVTDIVIKALNEYLEK